MIECLNLSLSWSDSRSSVEAIRNLSFVAKDGEVIAILGPSGCGKTSLLYVLAGLTKPNQGTVLVNRSSITGPSEARGIIFQTPRLFPWLSVARNVEFGLRMRKQSRTDRITRTDNMLRYIGLQDWRNSYPHELSGGMKQRVAVGRALVNEPEILLVDEPLTSLDRQTRLFLMQHFFLEESSKRNLTVLYVTHNVDEAILFAHKVLVLSARPATVVSATSIDLPYPRDPTSPEFHKYWLALTSQLNQELRKTFDSERVFDRIDEEA